MKNRQESDWFYKDNITSKLIQNQRQDNKNRVHSE